MKVLIEGKTIKQGDDSPYEVDASMSFEIEPMSGNMIISIDGKQVFSVYCNDIKRAIQAFDI